MAAVSVDFPKNKCNFLHKNTLDVVRRAQFLTRRRPVRSFSPGAVATIAVWKSAPMLPPITDELRAHLMEDGSCLIQYDTETHVRMNGKKLPRS